MPGPNSYAAILIVVATQGRDGPQLSFDPNNIPDWHSCHADSRTVRRSSVCRRSDVRQVPGTTRRPESPEVEAFGATPARVGAIRSARVRATRRAVARANGSSAEDRFRMKLTEAESRRCKGSHIYLMTSAGAKATERCMHRIPSILKAAIRERVGEKVCKVRRTNRMILCMSGTGRMTSGCRELLQIPPGWRPRSRSDALQDNTTCPE